MAIEPLAGLPAEGVALLTAHFNEASQKRTAAGVVAQ